VGESGKGKVKMTIIDDRNNRIMELEEALEQKEKAYLGWMNRHHKAIKERDLLATHLQALIEALQVDGRWKGRVNAAQSALLVIGGA